MQAKGGKKNSSSVHILFVSGLKDLSLPNTTLSVETLRAEENTEAGI